MCQLLIKNVKISIRFIFLFAIVSGIHFTLLAQEREVERELIVQFKSETVKLPTGLESVSLMQNVSFLPSKLQSKLRKHGAESLSKAFPEFNLSDTLKTSRTGEQVRLPDLSDIYTITLSSGINMKTALDSLQKLSEIVFVEPNGMAITQVVYPNDERFDNPSNPGSGGEQWNLLNTGQNSGTNDADIDAPEAWDITKGSSSTKIGIIDSGVRSTHEDLTGKVTGDATFSDHGTHVAGIAAAKTNNSDGIAGVDWNAQIISKVTGDDPTTFNAVVSAVNSGADILNSSYVLCSNCLNPTPTPRYSTLVRRAYASAYKMNVVSAAAMGNWNTTNVYYPVGFGQGIIAVGATNRNDTRWEWNPTQGSNAGNHIDVVAPGENITSATSVSTSSYASFTGTSMASPHIAGISGLLLAKNPSLYNDDIEHLIQLSAEDRGPTGFDLEYGYGRVNAYQALLRLQSPYT